MTEAVSRELGDFLRSRRNRLSRKPWACRADGAAGRPDCAARRSLSSRGSAYDWYVRLEQAAASILRRRRWILYRVALRLDPVERAHLRALTRNAEREPFAREIVSDGLRRTVEALNSRPM